MSRWHYAALVPVCWVAHPFGAVKAFYAMRIASVLLALTFASQRYGPR